MNYKSSKRMGKGFLYLPYNFLILILCLFSVACNRDQLSAISEDNGELQPVELRAGVSLLTRATDSGFELNDSIGLYLSKWVDNSTSDVLRESGNYADNAPFSLNSLPDSWVTGQTLYYPADGGKLDFYAYYPYRTPAFGNDKVINLSVAANQSAYDSYTRSDFMTAKTEGVKRSTNKVHLDFYHRLSQIVFVLKPGIGFNAKDLKIAKVKIINAITDGTFDLSQETDSIPVTGSVRQDITPCGSWTENDGNLTGVMAILMPQYINTATYIEVTIGSRKFTFKPASPIHLNSGCSREFTITVNNTNIDIETKIHPWNTCPAVNGEAEENEEYLSVNLENIDWTRSNVYRVMYNNKQIGEICKEYLYNLGTIDNQAIVFYPTDTLTGYTDHTQGFVTQIIDTLTGGIPSGQPVAKNIHGGKVSFSLNGSTTTCAYSTGTQAAVTTFCIGENNQIYTNTSSSLEASLIPDDATDYDNNSYGIVKIGTQYWLRENIKARHYADGNTILNTVDNLLPEYGRLYSSDAFESKSVIIHTFNWHFFNADNLNIMSIYLGGADVAGGKIKEAGTAHFTGINAGATNITGFTALPSGNHDGTSYNYQGTTGIWWEENAYLFMVSTGDTKLVPAGDYSYFRKTAFRFIRKERQ